MKSKSTIDLFGGDGDVVCAREPLVARWNWVKRFSVRNFGRFHFFHSIFSARFNRSRSKVNRFVLSIQKKKEREEKVVAGLDCVFVCVYVVYRSMLTAMSSSSSSPAAAAATTSTQFTVVQGHRQAQRESRRRSPSLPLTDLEYVSKCVASITWLAFLTTNEWTDAHRHKPWLMMIMIMLKKAVELVVVWLLITHLLTMSSLDSGSWLLACFF